MLGGFFIFFFFSFRVSDGFGLSVVSVVRRKMNDTPCPSVNQDPGCRALVFLT